MTNVTNKVSIGKISVRFDDLFKNNQDLTENTNRLINENTDILFSEIQPIVQTTLGDVATNVLKNVNDRFSIEELFPNE